MSGTQARLALKVELRGVLAQLARRRMTATYQEIAERVGMPGPRRIHTLAELIEETMREDHAAGRPLAGAIAVSRALDGLPQRGFFELLAELGRYDGPARGEIAAKAHARELEAAWTYWGSEIRD